MSSVLQGDAIQASMRFEYLHELGKDLEMAIKRLTQMQALMNAIGLKETGSALDSLIVAHIKCCRTIAAQLDEEYTEDDVWAIFDEGEIDWDNTDE